MRLKIRKKFRNKSTVVCIKEYRATMGHEDAQIEMETIIEVGSLASIDDESADLRKGQYYLDYGSIVSSSQSGKKQGGYALYGYADKKYWKYL